MPLRFPVAPMKAAIGTLPVPDAEWAFEIKYDGYRTLAFVANGALRLQSSNLLDVTAKYPELAGFAGAVNATDAIIDGELVALDERGRPRFELLQRHGQRGAPQAAFYAFDVLAVNGTDVVDWPYERRRDLLVHLVEQGPNWAVPAHRVGDGAALLAATAEQGLEGVMAKRLGSTYQVGKRSPSWRKVKNRQRVVVTIGGYNSGTGSRTTTFGALLVGVPSDEGLRFAGGVGSGFTHAVLADLGARLRALRTDHCPFSTTPPREYTRDATWVRPELRAEIEITEFTNEGFARHAVFMGLR